MGAAAPRLRLVPKIEPPPVEKIPPMPVWQAWSYAHWYVSWSIARAMYDSWDRAVSWRRE